MAEPRTEAAKFYEKQVRKLLSWLPEEHALTKDESDDIRMGLIDIENEVRKQVFEEIDTALRARREVHRKGAHPVDDHSSMEDSQLLDMFRAMKEGRPHSDWLKTRWE